VQKILLVVIIFYFCSLCDVAQATTKNFNCGTGAVLHLSNSLTTDYDNVGYSGPAGFFTGWKIPVSSVVEFYCVGSTTITYTGAYTSVEMVSNVTGSLISAETVSTIVNGAFNSFSVNPIFEVFAKDNVLIMFGCLCAVVFIAGLKTYR